MYLIRALNNLDILGNPSDNGIASKLMIYKIVKNYYDKNNIKEYHELDEKEKEIFIKEHMEEYVRNHNSKIKNKFYKYSEESRKDIKEFKRLVDTIKSKSKEEQQDLIINNSDNLDFGSYVSFYKYLSSLQQHLLYGSTKLTDWISTSTSFDSIMRYYNNQDVHRIAIIRSNTGGLVDSDNILSVDLSTMDKIKEKDYLCNKIDPKVEKIIDVISDLCEYDPTLSLRFQQVYVNKTNNNSRGFKYAINSKEICILKYIPKDHIVAILEALQIDLMRARLFNNEFLKLSLEQQKKELESLKRCLEFEVINQDDPFLKHVFEELYLKNKNIKSLVNFQDSEEKIKHNRNKILNLAKYSPNIQIKK